MEKRIKRYFIPGDEWVYFKIYTGYNMADKLLEELLPTIFNSLNEKGIYDKWFFIRYSDPSFHIRIRLHIINIQEFTFVLRKIYQSIKPYFDKSFIWKVQFDTYQRELVRYGVKTMVHSETIFFHDSVAILNLLKIIKKYQDDNFRWILALLMIDAFLDDFKIQPSDKFKIVSEIGMKYQVEFNYNNKPGKIILDKKYRAFKPLIFNALNKRTDIKILQLSAIIKNKSEGIKSNIDTILKMNISNQLELNINDFIGSHIHMMINRLFPSRQRFIEMVLYGLLEKFYYSVIMIEKSKFK